MSTGTGDPAPRGVEGLLAAFDNPSVSARVALGEAVTALLVADGTLPPVEPPEVLATRRQEYILTVGRDVSKACAAQLHEMVVNMSPELHAKGKHRVAEAIQSASSHGL